MPFPGKVKGDYHTYTSSTSLVKVLNPSTTNEVVLGVTDWAMPHKVRDPKAVSRSALGYPYHGIFSASSDLVPDFTDWGGGVPDSATHRRPSVATATDPAAGVRAAPQDVS